jgi:hypothetical protein
VTPCSTESSCPLTSVRLEECGPLTRIDLKVARDTDWTLMEGVQLVPPVCASSRGFIAFCAEDTSEVLRVSCVVARQLTGPSGFVPAGTSLLDLLARI